MTAEASHLDAIEAREVAASAEIARLCDGNPGTNWRWSIPANPARDSDLILSASIADVPYLLTLARKQQAAIEAVKKVAASMERIADFNLSVLPSDDMGISLRQHAEDIRAALEATP